MQEPRMLRRFGIHLIEDAAWVGGLLMLCILLAAQRRLPKGGAVAANLVTVAVLGLLVMLLSRVVDVDPWAEGVSARIYDAIGFLAAWSPFAICAARAPVGGRGAAILHATLVLASLMTGSMLAAALRAEPTLTSWCAAGLASLASCFWLSYTVSINACHK